MTNSTYNFGLITGSTVQHLKIVLDGSKGVATVPNNPYITVVYRSNLSQVTFYALQDTCIAFGQQCFNQNYTPTVLNSQLNPTYVSQNDPTYSIGVDSCDLTVLRPLEKGYGVQLILSAGSTYNIDLLIL